MLGVERLISSLAAKRGVPPAGLAAVHALTGEAPQSDDITVLALAYRPRAQE